jgi:hypothetical protein
MPYAVTYWPEKKLIHIQNVGKLTPDDYRAGAREALRLSREHGVSRCLIDDSALDNQVGTTDLYTLPDFYESIGIPKTIKAAVLISEQTPKISDIAFFETVCRNRGYDVKLFTSPDEAIAWLAT